MRVCGLVGMHKKQIPINPMKTTKRTKKTKIGEEIKRKFHYTRSLLAFLSLFRTAFFTWIRPGPSALAKVPEKLS